MSETRTPASFADWYLQLQALAKAQRLHVLMHARWEGYHRRAYAPAEALENERHHLDETPAGIEWDTLRKTAHYRPAGPDA